MSFYKTAFLFCLLISVQPVFWHLANWPHCLIFTFLSDSSGKILWYNWELRNDTEGEVSVIIMNNHRYHFVLKNWFVMLNVHLIREKLRNLGKSLKQLNKMSNHTNLKFWLVILSVESHSLLKKNWKWSWIMYLKWHLTSFWIH